MTNNYPVGRPRAGELIRFPVRKKAGIVSPARARRISFLRSREAFAAAEARHQRRPPRAGLLQTFSPLYRGGILRHAPPPQAPRLKHPREMPIARARGFPKKKGRPDASSGEFPGRASNCAEVCLCLCHLISATVCKNLAKEASGDRFAARGPLASPDVSGATLARACGCPPVGCWGPRKLLRAGGGTARTRRHRTL